MPAKLRLPITREDEQFARWRCWAAAVRDREPPHEQVAADAAQRAALLAEVLDIWEVLAKRAARPDAPANLAEPLDESILTLVGWLLLRGVRPPS
jgi:hypothetical protein